MNNNWQIPDKTIYTQNPRRFLEENTLLYSKAYGLLEYGYKLLFESAVKAYEVAGVFGSAVAPISKEEAIKRSGTITLDTIMDIAITTDEVNGPVLKEKLSDEEPLKEYNEKLDKIRKEVERAGNNEAVFKVIKCKSCDERMMLFTESLSSLESGITNGALLITKKCPKCGKTSSVLYGEDEKGLIKGTIASGN